MTPWDLPAGMRSRIRVNESGCWIWTGPRKSSGYGRANLRGVSTMAHRVTYSLLVGDVPPGLELDHVCRVYPCVNPEHVEPVTHAENMRRRSESITHCRYGHEFTPENTYEYQRGAHHQRCCKTCTLRRLARTP